MSQEFSTGVLNICFVCCFASGCLEWGPQALGVFQLNGEVFRGAETTPHFMGEDTHAFLGTNLKITFRPVTLFGYEFSSVLCYNLEPAVFKRSWDGSSGSWGIGVTVSLSLHLCYADTQDLLASLNCV